MPNIRTLNPLTVARVRSGVVVALVCAATDLDEALRRSLPKGSYSLTLAGPSGIRRRLVFRDGRATEIPSKTTFSPGSLRLQFTGAAAMANTLGGGKGGVLPLPLSPFFLRSLKAFVACSRRVGELTSIRDFPDESRKIVVTEMLMTAALRGVAETAMSDSWTAPKSAHMSNGFVEFTEESSGLSGWIECQGRLWRAGRGSCPEKPNARLSFADMETAFGLFTGSVSALNALGRGMVGIRGRVPMIQVLFPLLERFGEIMQWSREVSR